MRKLSFFFLIKRVDYKMTAEAFLDRAVYNTEIFLLVSEMLLRNFYDNADAD